MDAVQNLAMSGVSGVWSFILNFLAFLVIGVALFVFGFKAGKGNLISFTLSLYVGFALYTIFPYFSLLVNTSTTKSTLLVLKIILYAVLSFVSYLILRRFSGKDFFGRGHLATVVISFLVSGFIIAVLYHTFGAKSVYPFTPSIDQLFAPSQYFFWWFIAPLVAIFFFGR
jgi:hypothetical protein